ncbi:hypothetical protein [Bacillus sp. JCM 19034]|uniref:hypothetical protein n=1 Tax=Bacillus sp. JCM 19034 TaxID=1481928 RepID=UPI000785962E|nr:hypothetical protein [Bacillus sp. JCM 19034]
MWLLMIVILFVLTIGLTMGGLLAAPKYPPRPISVALFAIAFLLFLLYWDDLWNVHAELVCFSPC